MSILYVLIPITLVLVGVGLWAFFWATGSGQFDDLDSPGWSVLTDDEGPAAREPLAAEDRTDDEAKPG